jgi:hypothetical protein
MGAQRPWDVDASSGHFLDSQRSERSVGRRRGEDSGNGRCPWPRAKRCVSRPIFDLPIGPPLRSRDRRCLATCLAIRRKATPRFLTTLSAAAGREAEAASAFDAKSTSRSTIITNTVSVSGRLGFGSSSSLAVSSATSERSGVRLAPIRAMNGLVFGVMSRVSPEEFDAALEDLGIPSDVDMWMVAAGLVEHMGFHVW